MSGVRSVAGVGDPCAERAVVPGAIRSIHAGGGVWSDTADAESAARCIRLAVPSGSEVKTTSINPSNPSATHVVATTQVAERVAG